MCCDCGLKFIHDWRAREMKDKYVRSEVEETGNQCFSTVEMSHMNCASYKE